MFCAIENRMNPPVDRFCPICKIENIPGALTCTFCNHPLHQFGIKESKSISGSETHFSSSLSAFTPHSLLLFVSGFSHPIYLEGKKSFILGRNLENGSGPQGESIFDLSPFDALDYGVSRQHALIRPLADGFEICDMGSTNGTWLNQTRVLPGRSYRLDEESEIQLGRMVVHLVVRAPSLQTSSIPN
jgi:hypothetical protein